MINPERTSFGETFYLSAFETAAALAIQPITSNVQNAATSNEVATLDAAKADRGELEAVEGMSEDGRGAIAGRPRIV